MRIRQKGCLSNKMMKVFKVCVLSAILLLSLSACWLFQANRSEPKVVVVKEEMSLEEAMTLVAEATVEGREALKSEGEAVSSSTPQVNRLEQGESLPPAQAASATAIGVQATQAMQAVRNQLSTAQVLLSTQTQVIRQRTLQPVSTLALTATEWPSAVATNPTTFFRNTFTPLPTSTFTTTPTQTFTPTPIPPGLRGLTVDQVKAALASKGITQCREETDNWVRMTVCEAQTSDRKNWYYAEIYSVPALQIAVNNVIMAVFQTDPNDEVALDKLSAVAELNYDGSNAAAARAWLEQNLPSLGDENDKRKNLFGGVWFVLYGPKNGVRFELGSPPPYPTPPS